MLAKINLECNSNYQSSSICISASLSSWSYSSSPPSTGASVSSRPSPSLIVTSEVMWSCIVVNLGCRRSDSSTRNENYIATNTRMHIISVLAYPCNKFPFNKLFLVWDVKRQSDADICGSKDGGWISSAKVLSEAIWESRSTYPMLFITTKTYNTLARDLMGLALVRNKRCLHSCFETTATTPCWTNNLYLKPPQHTSKMSTMATS